VSARLIAYPPDVETVRIYDSQTQEFLLQTANDTPFIEVTKTLHRLDAPPATIRIVPMQQQIEISELAIERTLPMLPTQLFARTPVTPLPLTTTEPRPQPQTLSAANAQTSEMAMGLVAQATQSQVEATKETARYVVESNAVRHDREIALLRDDLTRAQRAVEERTADAKKEVERVREELQLRYAGEIERYRKQADDARLDYDARTQAADERASKRFQDAVEQARKDRDRDLEEQREAHRRELTRRDDASDALLRSTQKQLQAQVDLLESKCEKLERRCGELNEDMEAAGKKLRIARHEAERELDDEREKSRKRARQLEDRVAKQENEIKLLRDAQGAEHTQIVDLVERIKQADDDSTRDRLFSLLANRLGSEPVSSSPWERMMDKVIENPRLLADGLAALTTGRARKRGNQLPNTSVTPPAMMPPAAPVMMKPPTLTPPAPLRVSAPPTMTMPTPPTMTMPTPPTMTMPTSPVTPLG
jgi:hypothetical protein